MIHPTTFFFIVFLICGIGGLVLWQFVLKPTQRLAQRLEQLRARAQAAQTLPEIQALWAELLLANKECWHRNQGHQVRVIATILETKQQMLSQ